MRTPIHTLAHARPFLTRFSLSFSNPLLPVILLTASPLLAASPSSNLDRTVTFNIPTQPIELALIAFSQQADIQVVMAPDATDMVDAPALNGTVPARAALDALLRNSGLKYAAVGKSVSVVRVGARLSSDAMGMALSGTIADDQDGKSEANALDPARNNSSPNQTTAQDRARGNALEEILVTAQKRSERLMDVPAAISALGGARLESLNYSSLSDFAGYIPGLTTVSGGVPGQNLLVIRGLSTGYGATTGPLVATYIDELPVSSSNGESRGSSYGWDLLPYDIDRIEVLRGPQGTLYGADALGGLVKYVLRKPDLTKFDAQVGGNVDTVNGGNEPGYGGHVSVNVPLISGTFGFRASGFYKRNSGYIDNIGTGTKHSNVSSESGGRFTALWRPSDTLSIQATVLAQNIDAADKTAVTLDGITLQPVFGRQARSTRFPEPYTQQARDYSLNFDWDLGFATLTNSAAWSKLNSGNGFDLTPAFGLYAPDPTDLVDYIIEDKNSKFTEELRLTSPEHQQIQWIIGAFYTREIGEEDGTIPVYTPTYVPLVADNLFVYANNADFRERAVFGNLRLQISNQFDIGGGARYSQNTETDCTPKSSGPFGSGNQPCIGRPYVGVATWMADTRFHVDENSMFYLRYATGYRPGGCNNGCVTSDQLQLLGTFGADTTANYEAGFKGQFLDHRLQVDLSVFHIDWHDIQVLRTNSLGLTSTINGGTATSNGFELSAAYQLSEYLELQAALDSTDAHLTQDSPSGVIGKKGDQLSDSPRWSGSLTAEYHLPLNAHMRFVLGGGYRYRDKIENQLASTGYPLPVAPQDLVDLYTGLVTNRVTGRLYVNNVFNQRSYNGLLYLADLTRPMFVPVQPRTIGFSLDYQY